MQKIKSIIYVALLATAGLLAVLINPLVVLLASASIIAFLSIARQMNLYKMAMLIKSYAKKMDRLRAEIRAKVQTGIRDYNGTLDDLEESHRGRGSFLK